MEDYGSTREHIIASLFSPGYNNGREDETYVSHVKIWEEVRPAAGSAPDDTLKPRFLILAASNMGIGNIYKAKKNNNGTYSIGKRWPLEELRGVEMVNTHTFNMTMGRTYPYLTRGDDEQTNFLVAVVRLFYHVMAGQPLSVVGFQVPDNNPPQQPNIIYAGDEYNNVRTPTQAPIQSRRPRPPSSNGYPESPQVPPLGSRTPPRQPMYASEDDSRYYPNNQTPTQSSYQSRRPRPPSNNSFPPPQPASTSSPLRLNTRRSESPSLANGSSGPRSAIPYDYGSGSDYQRRPSGERAYSQAPLEPPPRPFSEKPSLEKRLKSAIKPPRPFQDEPPPETKMKERSQYIEVPQPQLQPGAHPPPSPKPKRDMNARVSHFDPANQSTADRLLASTSAPGVASVINDDTGAESTMANVEEMLEGFEWGAAGTSNGMSSSANQRGRGAADQIEARLLDELSALEKANIHSFLESDDRIGTVLKYIDDAVKELDDMQGLISSYKMHLNAVDDDIGYIQSQNRGLQVQTQNQKALLNEVEQLLQTIYVDRESLVTLTQESLETERGIKRLEESGAELYKAMQAAKDNDMAASMERLGEYRTHNGQFCKRLLDFLSIMFKFQTDLLLNDKSDKFRSANKNQTTLLPHEQMENYLGRYCGLMLYLKEMDEDRYSKICGLYFSTASEVHSKEMKTLMSHYLSLVKRNTDEPDETGFGPSSFSSAATRSNSVVRRAGTIVRTPGDGKKDKDKGTDGELPGSEAFGRVLGELGPQIYREQEFISDFLQINDHQLTFADYMNMEAYFCRQAARTSTPSPNIAKLVRGAMDLIFGFLPAEFKTWVDTALQRDGFQLVGIIAYVERFMMEAEDRGNMAFHRLLQKQHQRMMGLHKKQLDDMIKSVEQTKLTTKKRNGVAPFIKYFPVFVGKVENQLLGSDKLDIRGSVNAGYEKIIEAMFESLQHMAKMDNGDGEDKGQLNYDVILIENMHYFVTEMSQLDVRAIKGSLENAENIYNENLSSYVKLVLRRPFAKILDYFDGVERLSKTTAPSEVSSNSNFNKSSLKKVVREYNSKDVRKHVDALFKRVDKHFSETGEDGSGAPARAGTVLLEVWKACEEELVKDTERFGRFISSCYKDSGLPLEYTAADVEASFRRHRA